MFRKTGKVYIEIKGVCSYNVKKCERCKNKKKMRRPGRIFAKSDRNAAGKMVHLWKTVISEAGTAIRITEITAITITAGAATITMAPGITATDRWS